MTLELNSRADFTLDVARRVALEGEGVVFGEAAVARMTRCRESFMRLLDDPEVVIYGVTTGFGHQAHKRLTPEERLAQGSRGHHAPATSFGEPLPERVVRAAALARLTNYVEGHAAISPHVAIKAAEMLSWSELPQVPALGNGSPGEIQPLAHLYAPLMHDTPLAEKDGLALVNGSPFGTALLVDGAFSARRRYELALKVFALAWEALMAPLAHIDPALDSLWEDPFEAHVLQSLRAYLEGAPTEGRRYYQAPVSWRNVPRTLGYAFRVAEQVEATAEISLRAVSDNPVYIPPDEANPDEPFGRVLSNGGYHNAKAYPLLDDLAAASADLALLCERQVTKLLDGNISRLPHNLVEDAGVYIGCTAFSTVAYAEQARYAAQRTFLPGAEGGGFGQNDVAVPTFFAWRKEGEAGRSLDSALALLAVVANQALRITGREAPPRLKDFSAEIDRHFPPLTESRLMGPDLERLQIHFTESLYS